MTDQELWDAWEDIAEEIEVRLKDDKSVIEEFYDGNRTAADRHISGLIDNIYDMLAFATGNEDLEEGEEREDLEEEDDYNDNVDKEYGQSPINIEKGDK